MPDRMPVTFRWADVSGTPMCVIIHEGLHPLLLGDCIIYCPVWDTINDQAGKTGVSGTIPSRRGHTVVLIAEARWHGIKPARVFFVPCTCGEVETLEGHTHACASPHVALWILQVSSFHSQIPRGQPVVLQGV